MKELVTSSFSILLRTQKYVVTRCKNLTTTNQKSLGPIVHGWTDSRKIKVSFRVNSKIKLRLRVRHQSTFIGTKKYHII